MFFKTISKLLSRAKRFFTWLFFIFPRRVREYEMRDQAILVLCVCVVILSLVGWFLFGAPSALSASTLVKVQEGDTLSQVADTLAQKKLIRFPLVLKALVRLEAGDAGVTAGEYYFSSAQSAFTIARRLERGEFDLTPIRVTVPEGATAKEISELLGQKLPDFDAAAFYTEAKPLEGHLFPDTYFFLPGQDVNLVLKEFQNDFNQHIRMANVALAITNFGKPLGDVLTMASILQEEGSDTQNRRIIAGILWKRISLGMPLQVDAVFKYIFAGSAFDLTTNDLEVDSPYNTYTHKGLPPGPIGNPSLDAILDAVTPIQTTYLYYLSDKDGTLHYATTYAEHLANKKKYLNQ